MSTTKAILTDPPVDGKISWSYTQVAAPRQPKEHEVLVRIIAAGICHTDIFVAGLPEGALGLKYPKILGHEGAGEVEAVGPGVTVAKPGDRVLLSYNFCASCQLCSEGKEPYCENFHINTLGEEALFQTQAGKPIAGKFFGQSSFAALTLVDEKCIVNVQELIQTPEELKRCAPLGCGLMTGSGAVLNNVKADDILLITGIGAVGAGAIMTAKIVGCKAIIAVDRQESRLAIAKELGATHIYDTTKGSGNFVEGVRALVDGQRISYAIDTTGVVPVMENCLNALGKRGKLLQIGVPGITDSINIQLGDFFFQNKVFEVNYLGDARADKLVPQMIQWYKEGKFPIDKIVHFYRAEDIDQALEDMKTKVMKPIIKF